MKLSYLPDNILCKKHGKLQDKNINKILNRIGPNVPVEEFSNIIDDLKISHFDMHKIRAVHRGGLMSPNYMLFACSLPFKNLSDTEYLEKFIDNLYSCDKCCRNFIETIIIRCNKFKLSKELESAEDARQLLFKYIKISNIRLDYRMKDIDLDLYIDGTYFRNVPIIHTFKQMDVALPYMEDLVYDINQATNTPLGAPPVFRTTNTYADGTIDVRPWREDEEFVLATNTNFNTNPFYHAYQQATPTVDEDNNTPRIYQFNHTFTPPAALHHLNINLNVGTWGMEEE